MTAQTEVAEVNPAQVAAEPGSRLQQLHERYAEAKAAAAESAERLKAITDALKVELTTAAPNAQRIDLVGEAGPPLRLTYSESWRVDARKLKADAPEIYVRYAKKSGSWTLKAGGGDSE